MATNPYFNNFNNASEQGLIEDLVIESIKMYGLDCYYLPRTIDREDVFREAEYTEFNQAISIEMYVRSTSGYAGEGKMLNMMGVEIRDEMTFSIAGKSFRNIVGAATTLIRPNEGDLIFFAPAQKMFQISFVNQEAVFYQMGSIQFYDVSAELMTFSNEVFNTGVAMIDDIYKPINSDPTDPAHEFDNLDDDSQNEEFEKANDVLSWDERDPFSENGML